MSIPKIVKTSDGTIINKDNLEFQRYKSQRESLLRVDQIQTQVDHLQAQVEKLNSEIGTMTRSVSLNHLIDQKLDLIIDNIKEIHRVIEKR